jgi:hypothetical protein
MRILGLGRRTKPRELLLRSFGRGGVGAEIGVFRGDFSEQILLHVRPHRLHLIDPWKFEPAAEYERSVYGRARAGGQSELDAIYRSVRERFDHEIQVGTVVIHRMPSEAAATSFADEYFDWVYIDGNHLYEFVMRDLESYYPKVKPGGLITGDDYGLKGWWKDGVKLAVDEFAQRGGCDRLRTLGTQFTLRKRK